jgi:phosphohistidine swiveling domain-containing protein
MKEIGGKAANLEILSRLPDVRVPPFLVLDASWFRRYAAPLAGGMDASPPATPILADAQRSRIQSLEPAADLKEWAAVNVARLRGEGHAFLSVRSSALGEDSAEASFAGQFETVLNVPAADPQAVVKAILRCWASVFSDRALAYRSQFKLPTPPMAVVVQSMVSGEVSGVCFTANPVTRDLGELVVSATWGLGEGIVSGRFEGDEFTLSRETGLYAERVVAKPARLGTLSGGGTGEFPVSEEQKGKACLSPGELELLKRGALSIEAHYRQPLDLEFTFQGGRLYFLQARPITVGGKGERARWGRKILWDNSNIVESYNGLTSPFTFSVIAYGYQEVYQQFGRMLGIRPTVQEANQIMLRNYLGLINGRVYYNLMTWYRSFSFLPFFKFTGKAMETMMGVRHGIEIKTLERPKPMTPRLMYEGARLVILVSWSMLRAQSRIRAFQERFARKHAEYAATPWDNLAPHRLVEIYEEMLRDFTRRWQAPILADTLAMIFYKSLSILAGKWVAPDDAGFPNDLLSNQGNVESTEPTRKILECFAEIRDDAYLTGAFRATPADGILSLLKDSKAEGARRFIAWLDGYLRQYGSRSMNELKLEVPTLEEDPTFIFTTLKNYFSAPDLALASLNHSSSALREGAEARADKALRGHPFRGILFRWVLKNAGRNIRNREAMRFARSRLYGLMRRLALAYGKHLADAGILEKRDDVFFLSIQEIQAYTEGRALTQDLGAVAAQRKSEYAGFAAEEPADRFHTVGLPYHRHDYAAENAISNSEGNVLKGQSCCAGIRRGKVRVIKSPEDDLRLAGEILAAPRTDPGWIPLYPSISALLIEKGSVLSHSAIVAREMGIPTVVGIENLINRVKDGDMVEVDGGAGTVRILEAL